MNNYFLKCYNLLHFVDWYFAHPAFAAVQLRSFGATQKSGRIPAVLPPSSCGTNKNTTPAVSYCAVRSVSGCDCNMLPSQTVLVTMTIVIVIFIYLLLVAAVWNLSHCFLTYKALLWTKWFRCSVEHLCALVVTTSSSWDPFGYVTSFTSLLQAFYPSPSEKTVILGNSEIIRTCLQCVWCFEARPALAAFENAQPSLAFEIELVWRWGPIKRISLSVWASTICGDAKSEQLILQGEKSHYSQLKCGPKKAFQVVLWWRNVLFLSCWIMESY